MSLSLVPEVWLLEKSLGIYRLYYNGLKGHLAKWAVCRYSQNPTSPAALTFSTKNKALICLYTHVCSKINNNQTMGMSKEEQSKAFREHRRIFTKTGKGKNA